MGFFAVVHPHPHKKHFEVERCHLNLFALRRWTGNYTYLWDIGILFKEEAEAPTEVDVQLALPFGTAGDSFEDLSPKMRDQSLATQVFGERVAVNENEITVPSYGDSFVLAAVSPDQAKPLEKLCDPRRSLWEIKISLVPKKRTYVRVRFKVVVPSQLWQWQPNSFIRDGALIDLRVADVRGAATNDWLALSERIAPIPYLNAFVVVPVYLRLLVAFPIVKYARLIEPSVWQRYLDWHVSDRFVIYHWKYHEKSGISQERPFHAYLDLRAGSRLIRFSICSGWCQLPPSYLLY